MIGRFFYSSLVHFFPAFYKILNLHAYSISFSSKKVRFNSGRSWKIHFCWDLDAQSHFDVSENFQKCYYLIQYSI